MSGTEAQSMESTTQATGSAGAAAASGARQGRARRDPSRQDQRRWFEQVYAQHYGLVFGFLRARVLGQSDAEDLTQEVFLRFYNGMDRYDPERASDVRPWLRGISRNVLREHIRRLKRRNETGWTELCLELDQLIGGDEADDERLSLLPSCIDGLGDSSKQAIRSHYMGGRKLADIAQQMGRTVGAVKVLMVRSRQALHRCVDDELKRQGLKN